MPKRKAAYGEAASARNGAKIVLAAGAVAEFELPQHIVLCEAAQLDWSSYWADPVASAQTVGDRAILVRWIDALNRYYLSMAQADADPVVSGSRIDNPRPNPYYKIAQDALITVKSCEYQLGIGARNRVGLGMAIADARNAAPPSAITSGPEPVEERPQLASVRRLDPRAAHAEQERAES